MLIQSSEFNRICPNSSSSKSAEAGTDGPVAQELDLELVAAVARKSWKLEGRNEMSFLCTKQMKCQIT